MTVEKRVAVIGARGGIGSACMTAFAAAGWKPVGADLHGCGDMCALDVTDAAAVDAFALETEADALVYTAGEVATMPITGTDFNVWRRVLAVNLDGAAHAAAAFARVMIARGRGGAMVFLSSAAGLRGEANASAYCASKAGLVGLVESVAAELVPHQIRVNAVAPGNVDTPMLRRVAHAIAHAERRPESEVWSDMSRSGAADRLVAPEEVAAVCVALCGNGFSAVTGAAVPVDAGYLLS